MRCIFVPVFFFLFFVYNKNTRRSLSLFPFGAFARSSYCINRYFFCKFVPVHNPVDNSKIYNKNKPLHKLQNVCCIALSLIHISEPTRLGMISYAVFCLKKK